MAVLTSRVVYENSSHLSHIWKKEISNMKSKINEDSFIPMLLDAIEATTPVSLPYVWQNFLVLHSELKSEDIKLWYRMVKQTTGRVVCFTPIPDDFSDYIHLIDAIIDYHTPLRQEGVNIYTLSIKENYDNYVNYKSIVVQKRLEQTGLKIDLKMKNQNNIDVVIKELENVN